MTYLTPDDWGLNHNIAPGDARGPQPPPEPFPRYSGNHDGMWGGNASKGLAVRPPFRGYFGAPPSPPAYDTRTHSPFSVPDGLWTQGIVPLRKLHGEGALGPILPNYTGLQGLGWGSRAGVAGLGDTPDQILAKMTEEMKRAAMESAAAQTALLISLNYVPVVGTAVSLVLGVVMAIGNNVYKRKAMKVLADFENNVNALAASYEAKLHTIKMAVFDQEKVPAIQLALSGSTLDGLGHLDGAGDTWRKTWKRVVSPVYHLQQVVKAVQLPVKVGLQQVQRVAPSWADPYLQKPINQMDLDQARLAKAQQHMEKDLSTLSGERQWQLAQERAAQAYAAASKDMEAQFQAAVSNVQSTQYRQALQIAIAKQIRSDPSIASLISNISSPQAQSLVARMTGQVSSQPGAGVPIPQQTSTSEKAAFTAVPLIGAFVAFLALGGRG